MSTWVNKKYPDINASNIGIQDFIPGLSVSISIQNFSDFLYHSGINSFAETGNI